MKIRQIIWTILLLVILQKNDVLLYIPGTDADGSTNYSISIGNDDCYATFQTGDYFGVVSSCGTSYYEFFYNYPGRWFLKSPPVNDGVF